MVMGTAICKHALFRCVSQNEEMEENKNKLKHAESVRINKQINEDIKRDKKRQRNRYKLLMLGCGESGKVFIPIVKSTFESLLLLPFKTFFVMSIIKLFFHQKQIFHPSYFLLINDTQFSQLLSLYRVSISRYFRPNLLHF